VLPVAQARPTEHRLNIIELLQNVEKCLGLLSAVTAEFGWSVVMT
jgi:hypothetical protein